jgi:gas vesicle protein
MSQNDNFAGGFLAGAVIGGLVGGILGSLLTRRESDQLDSLKLDKSLLKKSKQPKFTTEDTMEESRLSLEDKIAQLNHAIDDVRHQLGRVNDNTSPNNIQQSEF